MFAENFFKTLFETSPCAIMVTDDDGVYVEINPAACELLGHRREKIIGKKVTDFVAPVREPITKHLWETFKKEGQQSGTFIISRTDGTDRIIKYVATVNFIPGHHVSYAYDTQLYPI